MYRDEVAAALARAVEAERRVAELEERDRARAAELVALRAELEAARATAGAPVVKRERWIWSSLVAAMVLLECGYGAACVGIAITYGDPSARWYGLFDDAFHERVPLAISATVVGVGLVLMMTLLSMALRTIDRLPEDSEHPPPSSRTLLLWAMLSGPLFILAMPWFLVRLGRCDGDADRRFHASMTVFAIGLHDLFLLPATLLLFSTM